MALQNIMIRLPDEVADRVRNAFVDDSAIDAKVSPQDDGSNNLFTFEIEGVKYPAIVSCAPPNKWILLVMVFVL